MERNKLTMRILILVIALLALVILYAFVVRPAVTGYAVNNYVQGYNQAQADFINNIWTQIQQTGAAQIPVGENQALVLQGQIFQTTPAQ